MRRLHVDPRGPTGPDTLGAAFRCSKRQSPGHFESSRAECALAKHGDERAGALSRVPLGARDPLPNH